MVVDRPCHPGGPEGTEYYVSEAGLEKLTVPFPALSHLVCPLALKGPKTWKGGKAGRQRKGWKGTKREPNRRGGKRHEGGHGEERKKTTAATATATTATTTVISPKGHPVSS